MSGNPLTIPSDEEALFGQKGGGGAPGTPGIGPGGGFGGGGGTSGGTGGGGFFGAAPGYNRGLPQFGYRRPGIGSNPYAQMNMGIQKNRSATPYSFLGVNSMGIGQGSGQASMMNQGYAQPMGGRGGFGGGNPTPPKFGGIGIGGPLGRALGGGLQNGTNPAFDPSNPWAQFSGDTRGDFRGAQNRIFGDFGASGAFGPNGNPAIMQAIQENYARQSGSRQNGIRSNLQASGNNDPNAYAYGALRGDLGLQDQMSGAMSQAQLAQLMNQQQFGQDLFSRWQGGEQGLVQGEQQHRFQPKPQSGWGQTIGTLAGAGIGAFFGAPGIGASLGGAAGGMFGGGGGGGAGGGGSYGPSTNYNDPSYGWGGGAMQPQNPYGWQQ